MTSKEEPLDVGNILSNILVEEFRTSLNNVVNTLGVKR